MACTHAVCNELHLSEPSDSQHSAARWRWTVDTMVCAIISGLPVNWTLPPQQENKAETSFLNETRNSWDNLKTYSGCAFLCSVLCLEQRLFFDCIILSVLHNWLAFPVLTGWCLSPICPARICWAESCLLRSSRQLDICLLKNGPEPVTENGLHTIKKGFHWSRLRQKKTYGNIELHCVARLKFFKRPVCMKVVKLLEDVRGLGSK